MKDYNLDNGMPAHNEWKRNIERWKYLRDSYQGGLAYKNGEYLQRYTLETEGQYEQRIESTPLDCCTHLYKFYLFTTN